MGTSNLPVLLMEQAGKDVKHQTPQSWLSQHATNGVQDLRKLDPNLVTQG